MASASGHCTGANSHKRSQFTVAELGQWSSLNRTLPAVDKISALHIYDFDNTLFKTALPNTALWTGPTISMLFGQDSFINGGWWQDDRILGATGRGIEQEEARAWEGFWNEKIVDLVRLTMKQPDALCVLLTGRFEQRFADRVRRIVASKHLHFDMLCLKPQVRPANQKLSSTMKFKQEFLTALIETYKHANEIRIYEGRPAHTQGIRDFLDGYIDTQCKRLARGPIQAEVIQVVDTQTTLDTVVEVVQVLRMIGEHNEAVLKQPPLSRPNVLRIENFVSFTSYAIEPEDSKKLLELMPILQEASGDPLRVHGNHIIIIRQKCPEAILTKIGGLGSKMTWRVTGTASHHRGIWAASVTPVSPTAVYHCDTAVPVVLLAVKDGARYLDAGKIAWYALPPERCFTFTTTVSERSFLRVEADDPEKMHRRKPNGQGWRPSKRPNANAAAASTWGVRRGGRGDTGDRGGRGGRGGDQATRRRRWGRGSSVSNAKNKPVAASRTTTHVAMSSRITRRPNPSKTRQPPVKASEAPHSGETWQYGSTKHARDVQS